MNPEFPTRVELLTRGKESGAGKGVLVKERRDRMVGGVGDGVLMEEKE